MNSTHSKDQQSELTQFARERSKNKYLNIVGISAGYHDSACSLLQDGRLVAAAQEERFSRLKNDKSFPRRAFRYCLQQAGLTLSDIDCIAYYEDPCWKSGRQIWMAMTPELGHERYQSIWERVAKKSPVQLCCDILGYSGRIEIVDHHLSHAASAFYFSGFPEAAILTVDGVGDWPTTTYGFGQGSAIERFEAVDFPHSLGFFYSAITGYLGFEVNEGEYKVMGLAPYGRPIYVDKIRKLIETSSQGQYRLNQKYFGFLQENSMFSDALSRTLGAPPRQPESEILQFHMDIARSVQAVLEEIMLEKVRYLYSRFPSENLCMAGGVALNVVANSRCLREGPFRQLFVQPAAGDAGTSMGAAAVAHVRITNTSLATKLDHVYLGVAVSSSEIYAILTGSSAGFRDFRGRENELLQYTVARLLESKVIGWFHGRMEFGPRSLGARSILADPRVPDMRDRINALVKMRESFRPFAPAVLESEAAKLFDLDHPSPFMLETCRVIAEQQFPAITHVDGSARIQTVNDSTNPRFAALLREFDRQTGCPVLLNTSFNMRGEPIVCNAIDALLCFVRARIDVLVLEDFVLEREDIPALWEFQAGVLGEAHLAGEAVEHQVYTLL